MSYVPFGNNPGFHFLFHAELIADFSVGTGAATLIPWDSIILDTGTNFSGAAAYEWTVPETGFYHISISGEYEGNTHNNKRMIVRDSVGWILHADCGSLSGELNTMSNTKIINLTAAQEIYCHAWQASGVAADLYSNTARTFWQISRIYT